MIVAGIQLDIVWEDPGKNLERAGELVAEARDRAARFVVLPEMFATGFSMNAERTLRAADETLEGLAAMARRHEVWLAGGLALPGEKRPRNGVVVFDPRGEERFRAHKLHPFSLAGEEEHYESGGDLRGMEIEGLRVSFLVCYDLRFPEPFRAVASDTDLFVVPANWPERRGLAWRSLLRARAIENQAYVLGVNRQGRDGQGVDHDGDSALIDPLGEDLDRICGREGLVVGRVSADHVAELRTRFGFLADRREDLYTRLRAGNHRTSE